MTFLSVSLKFGYEESIKIVNVMYISFEVTQRFDNVRHNGKKSAFNVIMCCITHLPLPKRKTNQWNRKTNQP